MKISSRTATRSVLLLTMCSATAFADNTVVLDHNAKTGPKHDALVQCVQAARHNPALGQQLMLGSRMGVLENNAQDTRTYILSGTAWENGARVPVTARCVVGPNQTVASLTRINEPTIANAGH